MNSPARIVLSLILPAMLVLRATAQTPGRDTSANRPGRVGISAGMGVASVSASDVVDLVNATSGAIERLSTAKAVVDFFGAFSYPVSAEWTLKLEYSYLLGSYNIGTQFGTAEYTLVVHLPTLFLQYVLIDRGIYNVKVGAGAGYHFGTLKEKFLIENQFSGKGPGIALDIEANTAFGEHVYVYLGGDLRGEFIGDLTASTGGSPGGAAFQPALHFFGAGARLGFTYYFSSPMRE